MTGAAGGTVALQGIGTATGADGGAVFGAAKGATLGALSDAVWTGLNCTRVLNKACLRRMFV